MRVIARIMRDVMRYRSWYVVSILATTAYLLLDVYQRNMMGILTDSVTQANPAFKWQLMYMLGATFMAAPFHGLSTYSKALMSQRLMRDLRLRIGDKTAKISMVELNKQRSGDIISHLGSELRVLDSFVYYGLSLVTTIIVQCTSTLFIMFRIDTTLSVLMIFAAIVTVVIHTVLSRPLKQNEFMHRASLGDATHIAKESFASIEVVKSFQMESDVETRYNSAIRTALRHLLDSLKRNQYIAALGVILGQIPMILVLLVGAYRVSTGSLSVGMLMSMTMVATSFCKIMSDAPDILDYLRKAQAAGMRIYSYFDIPDEQTGTYTVTPDGEAVFALSGVGFAYEAERAILRDVTLEIKPGSCVALVGPSGGGKSTLLRLMCGFFYPTEGDLSCYGLNIQKWDISKFREHISMVTQDAYLFPGTIRDNVMAAKRDATEEEVREACGLAGLDEFIAERGLDEQVGEWGSQISGGQRQRIAIARAFLKNSPVVFLDEPTSALDSESERIVMMGFEQLIKGRTTIMVTHRESLLRLADQVIRIEDGAAVEVEGAWDTSLV